MPADEGRGRKTLSIRAWLHHLPSGHDLACLHTCFQMVPSN